MPNNIAEGLAFDVEDCRRVISEAWGRYTGQPVGTNTSTSMARSPGLFGLIQRRRQHLFRLPSADPKLPTEMGEYPHYQSDVIRQKHWELTSRLLENRFKIECTASPDTEAGRKLADRAEWILTYGAESIQERTSVDWQKALAQGASAYCYNIIHWYMDPELSAKTPDAEYIDKLPAEKDAKKRYKLANETDESPKGKYRETAASVSERAALLKSRSPFPFRVEIIAPDQVAFIEDDLGDAAAVWIKQVGIVDYNGKLAKDGLKLNSTPGPDGTARLSLEDYVPDSEVGMERPAPVGQTPSAAGWKQRIAISCIWTRGEYYELASSSILTGASETVINETAWVMVKGGKHPYGRVPMARPPATLEESEWDPALRYRPALDGLYDQKPFYDYTRALEVKISTEIAIKKYFIRQDVGAPPILEGDEEGDQVILTRDSAMAQVLPPGSDMVGIGPDDISAAFVRSRELQGEELLAAAPPTGSTPIEATTQPWTARFGQAQANAYPQMLLLGISKALAEMFRNWAEVAAKPVKEGGLGIPLYTPSFRKDTKGKKALDRKGAPIGMNAEDWDGIWIDVTIEPVSAAERVTQTQLGLQILNNANGREVYTPEMFVSNDMGVADATGHMTEVDAWKNAAPWLGKVIQQEMAKKYGSRVVVGGDGSMVDINGQAMDPHQVLEQNGVKSANGQSATVPGMGGQQTMGDLATMSGNGVAPVAGMAG